MISRWLRGGTLALALTAACGPSRGSMLEGEIAQAVQTSPSRIDLAALYPAAWDRVCVLRPGTSPEEVNQLIGARYLEGAYMVAGKDVSGLIFVRGAEVVAAVRYPRVRGDFGVLRRSYCLPHVNALFRAVRAPGRDYPAVVPLGVPMQ